MRPWNTQQIKQLEPQGRRQGTESASGEGKPDLNVVGDQLGDEDWDLLAHSVQDVLPLNDTVPAGQLEHGVDGSPSKSARPGAHSSQLCDPASE